MTWHLETDRLLLRPLETADAEPLLAVLGDPVAMRFYPRPFRRPDVEAWIARARDRYETDGFGLLGIVERETGELVGDCGPMRMEVDGEHHIELGWHVRTDRQRRGYATEAGSACRDRAFDELDPSRLISMIRPENVPSWTVARRLGFRPWRSTVRVGMAHLVWAFVRPAVSR